VACSAGTRASHNAARTGSASGGRNRLATTTPSIMSASTATHGRPRSRTETTGDSAPSGPRRRRSDRSTPTSRGGDRKPGTSWPMAITVAPMTRTASARSMPDARSPFSGATCWPSACWPSGRDALERGWDERCEVEGRDGRGMW